MRPLGDGTLLGHFEFVSTEVGATLGRHARLLPRSLVEVVEDAGVERLELTLTSGRFDGHLWGPSPRPAGSGGDLRVWFQRGNETGAGGEGVEGPGDPTWAGGAYAGRWKRVVHHLSGTFCAHLNQLERGTEGVASPRLAFNHSGRARAEGPGVPPAETAFWHGQLPVETVCTENLTPWLRQLPCRDAAGVAALFHRGTVFGGYYSSLAVEVERVPGGLRVVHSLTVVLKGDENIPRKRVSPPGERRWSKIKVMVDPVPLRAREDAREAGWESLRFLFGGRSLDAGACPFSATSEIAVDVPPGSSVQVIDAEDGAADGLPYEACIWKDCGASRRYPLVPGRPFDVRVSARRRTPRRPKGYEDNDLMPERQEGDPDWTLRDFFAPLHVTRFLTGHGKEYGGIAYHFYPVKNPGRGETGASTVARDAPHGMVELSVSQVTQWFVHLYVHTLRLQLATGEIVPVTTDPAGCASVPPDRPCVAIATFQGAIIRQKPALLELSLRLPVRVASALTLDFDHGFLTVWEFPPDANRGFDLPAAIITWGAVPPPDAGVDVLRNRPYTYAESLLVGMPTPDFSMPYNVGALTCALVTLFISSIVQLSLRRVEDKLAGRARDMEKGFVPSPRDRLASALIALRVRVFGRRAEGGGN